MDLKNKNTHGQSKTKNNSKPPKTKNINNRLSGLIGFVSLYPILTIFMNIFCNESICAVHKPDFNKYQQLSTYFNAEVYLSYIGFLLFLSLTTALPFGGETLKIHRNGVERNYVLNGLNTLLIVFVIFVTMEYNGVQVSHFIHSNWLQFVTATFVISFVLSIVTYMHSFTVKRENLNDHACTESHLYNFIMGRSVNPVIFGVDVKLMVLRHVAIGIIMLNISFIYTSLGLANSSKVFVDTDFTTQLTLITICSMHILYLGDQLFFEETLLYTYEVQYDGVGMLKFFEMIAGAFGYVFSAKYVLDHKTNLPVWAVLLCSVIFMFGYLLYRLSNSEKHNFRMNPNDKKYESILTSSKKRLLVSGYWGYLRHPNYLGDIILNISFSPFIWNMMPMSIIIFVCINLTVRSIRDNIKCERQYGKDWVRYCQRVPYVLIPKVY